jgi:uncharacterized protein YicC (UPF0701 family)
VEIRSLNNRFFKPVIKLPETVSGLEPEIETMLRERLVRGSSPISEDAHRLRRGRVSHQSRRPQAYLRQLESVAGLEKSSALIWPRSCSLPGVCQEPRDESDEIATHGEPFAN